MQTALETLTQLREKLGGTKPLVEALEFEGVPNAKSVWDSLVITAKSGHIVRRHEHRVRALAEIHGIQISGDIFLTKRERDMRAAAAKVAAQ